MKGSVFRSCAFILHPSSLILEELAVAEGFEPSIAGLTIRCLTNLATPQEDDGERGDTTDGHGERETRGRREEGMPSPCLLVAPSPCPRFGGDEGSRTLIDRFTRPALWFPVEL